MLPYFWYILKVIICSGILFGYYWLFLRNKIFHQYNRFYLLAALVLSLSLPILKIDFWQQNDPQQNQVIKALQVVSAGDEYMSNVIITADKGWSIQQFYTILYWAVSLIFCLMLLRTLFVIRSLLKKYPVQMVEKFSFVNTDDKSTPFSFLKYIFWNSNIDMDTTTGKQIFKHEVAHIQEKHTYDKLFTNTILIFFWCNPFFWLYRKELNMIHEFIADKKAVEDCDTASFAAMILQATYPQHRFQLTNNFFYSPIKRRLLMLTKNNNPKLSYVARLMVLPLAVLVFAAFSFKVKELNRNLKGTVLIDTLPEKIAMPIEAKWKQADGIVEEIDPRKALLVINGKIIGKGTDNDSYFNQIHAELINVQWLQKKAAIAKYGTDGADGACEVSYTDGATIKTAYVDENKMAVFYIGIDNPITINAQNVKPEDLVVQVSSGKIQGFKTNYIVKVFSPGEVKLTLSKRDGTKLHATFTIMAKRLPDPAKINLKEYLKGNHTDTLPLKEKLIVEERMKKNLTDAELELKLKSVNTLNEKIVLGQQLQGKQLIELKQSALQQDLNKIEFEQAQTKLLLKSTGSLKEQAILANKLKSQNLLIEKVALQQSKTTLNKAEKELLEKTKEDIVALAVVGHKLESQDLLKAKQNLQFIELSKIKMEETEKAVLQNKQLLLSKTEQINPIIEDNKVFTVAETSPQFTGGEDAWKKYLLKNIKPIIPLDEGWSAGMYTVIVKFIVLTDGTVIDVTTENYKGTKTALHCIEIIKNAPKWQPAVQNGHKVNAYKKQPITFVIEEQ